MDVAVKDMALNGKIIIPGWTIDGVYYKEIRYHEPDFENDRHYCDVITSNAVRRIFDLDHVVLSFCKEME